MRLTVCPIEDLPPGAARIVGTDACDVVVFNVDGDLVALDNVCAHRQQPLAEGVVRDGILTCPAHLWRYDIRTGERVDSTGWAVPVHPVSALEGEIVVDLPEPKPTKPIREQLLEHARNWNRDT